jgi:dienelactone hydrolase
MPHFARRALLTLLVWPLAVFAAAPTRLPRENLLLRHDGTGAVVAVKTVADWADRRAEIVRGMETVMGAFPGAASPKRVALEVRVEAETDHDTYVIRRITYQAEPGSRVPALLCIPKAALTAPAGSVPAVLCLHPTDNTVGPGVTIGLGPLPHRAYASELAARGYVTIAPAYPHLAGYAPDIKGLGYASGTMKAIWDNTRALDVLETLPFVRRGHYGAIGHSLGGHNALYTAVFEPRLAAIVSSCGFDSYLDYYGGKSAVWTEGKGWCQERYMLGLLAYAGRLADIPFDFHEILGALAPRPVFINAPLRDSNFSWASVDRVVASARAAYALHGATAGLRVEHPDSDHDFPDAQRETAYRLFDTVLR